MSILSLFWVILVLGLPTCPLNATFIFFVCLFLVRQPTVGQGLLIHEVSRSHTTMHQSVGLLWTSDQLVTETSTLQHTTLTTNIHAPGGI